MSIYTIKFLGTGSSVPSLKRGHSAIYLNVNGTNMLLDCGENTQKRILEENLTFFVDFIFISHLHLDHSCGVRALLKSMNLLGRTKNLKLFCGNKEKFLKLILHDSYDWLEIVEIKTKVQYIFGKNTIIFNYVKHCEDALSITISELNPVRYNKKKLEKLSESEKKELFNKFSEESKKNRLEYIESTDPAYTIYYGGDSVWDLKHFEHIKNLEKTLIIHECTYFINDKATCLRAKEQNHTHFKDFISNPINSKIIFNFSTIE